MPPVNRQALIGVGRKPPVPLGIDEVVVVVLVDGEVVGADVLEGNDGIGGAGCGPTQAVTSAATAATTTTTARAGRDCAKAALLDIPLPVLQHAGRFPDRSDPGHGQRNRRTTPKVTFRGQARLIGGESSLALVLLIKWGGGSHQLSLKVRSSRMEFFPASAAWPSSGVMPSICSMPLSVE